MAERISEHLELDMARLLDELLDEDPVVAEAALRLIPTGDESLAELNVVPGHPDALAATSGDGLQYHGIAKLCPNAARGIAVLGNDVRPGDDVDARLPRQHLRGDLVAHHADRVGFGTDECDAFPLEPLTELRVLCEKAIAGVHCDRPGLKTSTDDLIHGEV